MVENCAVVRSDSRKRHALIEEPGDLAVWQDVPTKVVIAQITDGDEWKTVRREMKIEERIGGFQIIVLLLSIIVLASMVVDALVILPTEASRILEILDHVVCAVFFLVVDRVLAWGVSLILGMGA